MKSPHDLSVLDHLLRHSPKSPDPIPDFKAWKKAWLSLAPKWEKPMDRALAGGLSADRPAWAFAAGYQAAIQSLTDPFGLNDIATISAVCITEKDGAHPARIASRLVPIPGKPGAWRLDGHKTFVSGGTEAGVLWVAATTGKTAQGHNQLRLARVPARTAGVIRSPMPLLGLVPEMPHAEVRFESVVIPDESLLPGDGYLKAVKPFRTVEDLHVTAAFLAWLFSVGRRADWPGEILETILSLIVCARGLGLATPLSSHVHIALGGLLGQVHHLLAEIEPMWDDTDPDTRAWWRRDRKILSFAEGARRIRRVKAWQYYGHQCPSAP